MITSKRYLFLTLLLLSCSPELSDDQIPFVAFPDFTVNINSYPALLSDGGYVYSNQVGYPNVGVKGIIIYRKNSTTFLAFEQNCSFQPNEACSTVNVDASSLFMVDACCGSTFNFNGDPTGGPAWRPLRQYYTYLSGITLTVTDEILE